MNWSFSQYNMFRRCQRQWFFKYKYANSNANDLSRNEAKRLSKLVNLKAWRGKIVDSIISDNIIPSFGQKNPMDLENALHIAGSLFQKQQLMGLQQIENNDNNFSGFIEVEYGNHPQSEAFEEAWQEIASALASFFKNSYIMDSMKEAFALKVQRTLTFKNNGISVSAIPDVICFCQNRAPLIIDWKVHSNPIGNYWKQLGLYALALTRCKPHRDWPELQEQLNPSDIRLAEMQLLTDAARIHSVTIDEIDELDEMITISSNEMSLSTRGYSPKQLQFTDFPSARFPETCDYCSFKRLCWRKL